MHGAQDCRVALVALLGGDRLLVELEGEISALRIFAIEQRTEHRIAVDARPRHPDDASGPIDEGRDIAVADHAEVEAGHESLFERRCEVLQPASDLSWSAKMRSSPPEMLAANLEANAAEACRDVERCLIGQIVADHNRAPPLETRRLHQPLERGYLAQLSRRQFQHAPH